jgi:hypothetical protein
MTPLRTLIAGFLLVPFVALHATEPGEPSAKRYTIPSWGDFAVVYAEGTDPAMDSPEGMERMFAHWKARGFTGVFLRSDLQQYEPFVRRHPRVQMNPALALMWRHVDVLASRFDYFDAAQRAAQRTGLEFWAYHPHIYSEGAPPHVGTPGPGRMMPWSYVSKLLAEHPEKVTIDRRGNRYWMVPEYAYPEVRRAKVAEFVHMARRYGIRHFIANMRSEVSQLIDPADHADRFGFNPPVVEDMRRLHGVDILNDARFDVDAPGFNLHDPMVENWRRLRGTYLTQLWRELRAGLRAVDPEITFAITLAGEYLGPPLGNLHTDWRTWVDEGLADYLISPVFFEATLDHEAGKKGYLTHSRAGIGTVPHAALRDYIQRSAHPEIQLIATGGSAFFFTPSQAPAGADGLQCDAWYDGYHTAWSQRWSQWQKDLREFGHIKFIEQNFDTVAPADFAMPSGAWGALAYDPKLRACAGAWWRLGDGTDTRPFAQEKVRRGENGKAMQLTRAAEGGSTLTGWHNASPDRGKFQSVLDTSMTSGRSSFEFWVRRASAESGIAAFLQGDPSELEVGVRIAADSGKISFSTGTASGTGQWVATEHILPVGVWQKFRITVDLDQRYYGAQFGDAKVASLCEQVPLSAPKERFVEQPGVNLPIRVPVFKEFKSVLFVPEGGPGSVTHLDDVAVRWQPAVVFAEAGAKVEFEDDFEDYPRDTALGASVMGSNWNQTPAEPVAFVTSDTSYGTGAHSLRATPGANILPVPRRALSLGMRLTFDADVLLRSDAPFPSVLPISDAREAHHTTIGWQDSNGKSVAAVSAQNGTWHLWNGDNWIDMKLPVHLDVWSHFQLVIEEDGTYRASVQPVGQVAASIGSARVTGAPSDAKLIPYFHTTPGATPTNCYDNVRLTSGPPGP